MPRTIDCSLLADGPSDKTLLPILHWLMREYSNNAVVNCEWADLGRLREKASALWFRIIQAVKLFPCDVLFVHRDAEGDEPERRYEEINAAATLARQNGFDLPHVCVIPVRMQEAWLLLDEIAIRRAAGNPNGCMPIDLPQMSRIETLPDPKETLYALLKEASGLHGGRLKKFHPQRHAARVTEYMKSFICLRSLASFQRLGNDVKILAPNLGAGSP